MSQEAIRSGDVTGNLFIGEESGIVDVTEPRGKGWRKSLSAPDVLELVATGLRRMNEEITRGTVVPDATLIVSSPRNKSLRTEVFGFLEKKGFERKRRFGEEDAEDEHIYLERRVNRA